MDARSIEQLARNYATQLSIPGVVQAWPRPNGEVWLTTSLDMTQPAASIQELSGVSRIDFVIDPFARRAYQLQVELRENEQGKGLGSRLVSYAESVAKDTGCRRIEFEHALPRATAFWSARGYEHTSDGWIKLL